MNHYQIFLNTSKYLLDENGMTLPYNNIKNMIKYHNIKSSVDVSPTIKINNYFKEGDSLSIECKGPKRSYGQHIITFEEDMLPLWFEGFDDYYYLMVELCDYTFCRYGESPFAVLKGKFIGDGVMIEELNIYDLSKFLCLCHSQDEFEKYNFRKNENLNIHYYDYTEYFNTSPISKL
jgi:hypothetical protein